MSEVYEPTTTDRGASGHGTKNHTTSGQTGQQGGAGKRAKANENVLGDGPEVVLDAIPKGRTAQVDEAVATKLRNDQGVAPALGTWSAGLAGLANQYGANRELVSQWYISHNERSPSSSVGKAQHAKRAAALMTEYAIATRLAKIESAAAFNVQARAAAGRLIAAFGAPEKLAEELPLVKSSEQDVNALREQLPPNLFRVLRANLGALQGELAALDVVLQGLKAQ